MKQTFPYLITFQLFLSLSPSGLFPGETDGWQVVEVPGLWEERQDSALNNYDGFAWYRCFVRVPREWKGKDLRLTLGRINDCDETFFNGAKVGQSGEFEPYRTARRVHREYHVTAGSVHYGNLNLIAIRVYDGGGTGGISDSIVRLSSSEGALDLRGHWQFRTGDDPTWAAWPVPAATPAANRMGQRFLAAWGSGIGSFLDESPLPGTRKLEKGGDIASQLIAGVDRFLLREIKASVGKRERYWKRDLSSHRKYTESVRPNREHLARIIGARDNRVPFDAPEAVGTTEQPAIVGRGGGFEAYSVRWPVMGDMTAEGLLLVPAGGRLVADIIAIPDADQIPEQIAGLVDGVAPESQFARRLAESGCRVLVPTLITRGVTHRKLSNREFLYRSAFELGRHLIGYEVQKVLAGVDWFEKEAQDKDPRIGVIGWGEGGLLALYAGALDTRIDVTCVSGYFDSRQGVWKEPVYRNVFGLLEEFGDAELASMIAPRTLIVEAAGAPNVVVPPGTGGAPGRIETPRLEVVRGEIDRARGLIQGLCSKPCSRLVVSGDGSGAFGTAKALRAMLDALSQGTKLSEPRESPVHQREEFDPDARHRRQMHEIDRHNQWLLRESAFVRKKFLSRLDRSSLEKYRKTVEPYRSYFYDEVIGRFEKPLIDPDVRSRKIYDEPGFTGYEVMLDVFEDVIAYGILLLPKEIRDGERRPVVVCQHGLEGRPRDVADPHLDNRAYHQYAAKLARRGFITFAPQNLYIFGDRFRTLQRKANPIKKTLFSVMVPQHQQIVDWLAALPHVDPERIAFYGLSYGGKSAMRIPPLVKRYCLSICSADFNEWVDKNASTRNPRSYVWSGEYEIFEFDLGSTFNYMEMAALIAPRPFMVERGHFDGVADDETVAYEFAKVRFLYAAQLKIPDRCEIEWFAGPHTINGKGTFRFLHRHLKCPEPERESRF